jgi:hypothetical protein
MAKKNGGNPSVHDAAKKINKRKQSVKNQLNKINTPKKKK